MIVFYKHNSVKSKQPSRTYFIGELPNLNKRAVDVFVRDFCKEGVHVFQIQQFKPNYYGKYKRNVVTLQCVYQDIDIHDPTQKALLLQHTGASDIKTAIEMLLQQMKGDEHIFFSTRSKSGDGIRIIVFIESYDENGNRRTIMTDSLDIIHAINFKKVLEYLGKYNIRYEAGYERNYIDMTMKANFVQNTFRGVYDDFTYVNYTPKPFQFIITDNEIAEEMARKYRNSYNPASITNISKEYQLTVTPEAITRISNENNELVNLLIRKYKPEDFDFLKPSFSHYMTALPFLCISYFLTDDGKEFFRKIFERLYTGSTQELKIATKTFNSWNNYLAGKQPTYCIPFKSVLDNYGFTESDDTIDLFGNKYDIVLYYKEHISEQAEELTKVFTNPDHRHVLIKGAAGGGKTYSTMEYLISLYESGYTVCFASPRNPILEQTHINYGNRVRFIRNYSENFCSLLNKDKNGYDRKNYFYLSSYESLEKIQVHVDFLVLDEIHELINLSVFNVDKQIEYSDAKKIIHISATPEVFLIADPNKYLYINLVKENTYKPVVHTYGTNNPEAFAYDFICEKRKKNILVFYNDRNAGTRLKKNLSLSGITATLLNADHKDSFAYKQIMSKNILKDGIYISTNLLTLGVNIENTQWDHVLLICTLQTDFFSVYQFANRLRKAKPTITMAAMFVAPITKFKASKVRRYAADTDEKYAKRVDEYFRKHPDARKEDESDHDFSIRLAECLNNPEYQKLQPFKCKEYLSDQFNQEKVKKNNIIDWFKKCPDQSLVTDNLLKEQYLYIDKKNELRVNDNLLQNDVWQEAFNQIRKNQPLYLSYFKQYFHILWKGWANYNKEYYVKAKTSDVFAQYKDCILHYCNVPESTFKQMYYPDPIDDELLMNFRTNKNKYQQYCNRIQVAQSLGLEETMIYLAKNKWNAKVAQISLQQVSVKAQSVGIIDRGTLELYNDVKAILDDELNGFEYTTTENVFVCLNERSNQYFTKKRSGVTSLGMFMEKHFNGNGFKKIQKHKTKTAHGYKRQTVWFKQNQI